MIPSITLENVQSHKKTTIEFHPGINLITGASDCGKSAVIRGLQWWALNSCNWKELQRHDTLSTSVEAKGVKKFRSDSLHYYEMDGQKYKALRTDVPQEIQAAIGLTPDNFQEQHAPYFLISDSAGEVAKKLNAVGDLQIIDLSLKGARHKVKEANTEEKYLKGELQKVTDKVEDLQWAVEADVEYTEIESLQAESASIEIAPLTTAISKIEKLQGEFDEIPITSLDLRLLVNATYELDIDLSIGDVIKKVEDNQVKIPDMSGDIKEINLSMAGLTSQQGEMGALESVLVEAIHWHSEVKRYPSEIDNVVPQLTAMQTAEESLTKLNNMFRGACVAEDCFARATAAHNEGKINFNDKLKELGHCPLCGGELEIHPSV